MSVSLEDQRRALLEQIEASRAVYRRMLTGESPADGARRSWTARQPLTASAAATGAGTVAGPAIATGRLSGRPLPGGRSKAVQWAMDHPLWVAGGVALLVLLLPRAIEARQRHARSAKLQAASPTADAYLQAAPRGQGSGAGRALLTAALLLLRDPARLQAAGRLVGGAWRWVQSRRAH